MRATFRPRNVAAYHAPFRPAVWGLVAIIAFALFFGAWGYIAPLSSAALAEGSLQVQARRQSVQHPDGGVISRLLVLEGQHVERGQPLIELDDTMAQAQLEIAEAQVVALLAQRARLFCERDDASTDCIESTLEKSGTRLGIAEAVANEHAVMDARARQYAAEKGMCAANVEQLREKISGLEAQADGLTSQHALLSDELKGARKLLASGFVSKTHVMALQRSLAGIYADLGARKAEIGSAKQGLAEAKLAIAKLESKRISEITDQIRKTESSLAETLPKLTTAREVMKRIVIRAPMSGSIVGLSVFTEGGVIQAGQRLMDIVPDDNPIIVDARLPLSDINGISTGDVADIRLTSVPRKDRPQLSGKVISISADKITDARSGASYFSIRVGFDPEQIRLSQVSMQPGMPAEVIIARESRTLVGYLLGPLLDRVTYAFREE